MTTSPGFTYAGPRAARVACVVCGARGYDRQPWQATHSAHLPCLWCGRPLVPKLDGTPRVHTRCPNRPTETT